jgi:streptomycin 6-kinase
VRHIRQQLDHASSFLNPVRDHASSQGRARRSAQSRHADGAALAVHIMINTALTGATYDIDGEQQFVCPVGDFD